jgi:hypothetical protein
MSLVGAERLEHLRLRGPVPSHHPQAHRAARVQVRRAATLGRRLDNPALGGVILYAATACPVIPSSRILTMPPAHNLAKAKVQMSPTDDFQLGIRLQNVA